MDIVSILKAMDLSRVPPDALPNGMPLDVAQQRILCSTAAFFDRVLEQRMSIGPSLPAIERVMPTHVATEAVKEAAKRERKPAQPPLDVEPEPTPSLPPELAPEPEAEVSESDRVRADLVRERDALLEQIGEAPSLESLNQVHKETEKRVADLFKRDPNLAGSVTRAFGERLSFFRAREKAPVPDVPREQIVTLTNVIREKFSAPDAEFRAFSKGLDQDALVNVIRNNARNKTVIDAAHAHHPDLAKQLEDVLARGRVSGR